MENILHGLILKLEFLKVQYWDHYFFLIYSNDLSDNLTTNPKLFADDTSLFAIVHDPNATANDLNNDLTKINDWAYQWKINFNHEPFKQAHEVLFSRRIKSQIHPCFHFNNNPLNQTLLQKHLGMYVDPNLGFSENLKNIQTKVEKSIALLRKLQTILPRPTLLTIYRAFIRPHLDYGDTIYCRTYNDSFHQNLESVQYNAALATTGGIRGTSSEKLYQELGLESLQQRSWYRKLCTFLKIIKGKSPDSLFSIIPKNNSNHRTRNSYNILQFDIKYIFFKNSFFPSVIAE